MFSRSEAMRRWTATSCVASLVLACGGRTGVFTDLEPGPDAESDARPDAAVGGRVLLYGGNRTTEISVLGDTWIWGGTSWSELTAPGPAARLGAAMTGLRGTAVLFGGQLENTGLTNLADTWTWEEGRWTERSVEGPSARFGAAMAAIGDHVVLFGGMVGPPYAVLGDTWIWDGADWTNRDVAGPSPRAGAGMATVGGSVLLFGSGSGSYAPFGPVYGDTWSWDGESWTLLADADGPSDLCCFAMAADASGAILFGGGNNPAYDALWSYNGTKWSGEAILRPSARVGSSMATVGLGVLLFGGQPLKGATVLDDTWIYQDTVWTRQRVAGPSPRLGAVLASLGRP
jgi:hypothetical protein